MPLSLSLTLPETKYKRCDTIELLKEVYIVLDLVWSFQSECWQYVLSNNGNKLVLDYKVVEKYSKRISNK